MLEPVQSLRPRPRAATQNPALPPVRSLRPRAATQNPTLPPVRPLRPKAAAQNPTLAPVRLLTVMEAAHFLEPRREPGPSPAPEMDLAPSLVRLRVLIREPRARAAALPWQRPTPPLARPLLTVKAPLLPQPPPLWLQMDPVPLSLTLMLKHPSGRLAVQRIGTFARLVLPGNTFVA
ncbi:hypothetical protein NEOLI_001359 [Neolecta irregularis DAH-3]|uniref:Uncharacterized protein n=1 Tax=Neolecta irregularis (strain DAH-3) TaxID=1198029 RepID=A0A1U7LVG6_NEOID|nr:hypothetical protein NEOLI_001359 [Neolecta irregularis DAH-3]|eukprot:OLL26542.1 hypothetical protein NEOLI_001359 [Neolecta irregularis DAH-3]